MLGVNINKEITNTLMPNEGRVKELGSEFVKMAHQNKWSVYSFQEEYGITALFGRKVRWIFSMFS